MDRRYKELNNGKIQMDMSRFSVEKKQRDNLGEALEAWYGTKQVYGLYKRIERFRGRVAVERAFDLAQKQNDKDISHFRQWAWNG